MNSVRLSSMTTSSASPSGDARLTAALEAYRALLEAGRPPDRAEFLATHADAGPELADCLAGLEFVHAAVPNLSSASGDLATALADAADPSGTLGDFRIIREIGRGGMGIVYEAEQLSLSRRIALKVLPFAATMDPRNLQRFKNEALAAASLDHPHIVDVYGVGCERGVHYYAMRLVEGQTLAAVIAALRQEQSQKKPGFLQKPGFSGSTATSSAKIGEICVSSAAPTHPVGELSTLRTARPAEFYRTVAQLAVQAAEALEHAHSQGIIHRDIKPSNLMVTGSVNSGQWRVDSKESRGSLLSTAHCPLPTAHLWITDFGLARMTNPGAEAGDASLTLTGDLIGTLRYMSPEQTLAKRVLLDHRTDIYSLGATLYELLTLRPAFAGDDRHELLRQIAFEEPQPPRKVNKSIPAELEIIALKAMEKNPADRYASAQELALDLKRFLKDEPIRARRPTFVQRARKWSRRHPAVMRSAALVLVLLTAGSSLSTFLVWQEKKRTSLALTAEKDARKRADDERRTAEERDAETKAVLKFVEDEIIAVARPEGQAGGLGAEVSLRRALEQALPFVEKSFVGQPLIEARLRRTLGLSFHYLGDDKVALQQFQAAHALYVKNRGPEHPHTLAVVNNLANSYAALGRLDDAIQLRKETLVQRQAALGADDPATLDSMNNLANSLDAAGRHFEALELRQDTLRLRQAKLGPDDPATLASMNNLAISYTVLGRHEEAVKLREKTLALLKAKSVPDVSRTLAAMNNLAESYQALGRCGEALPLFEETLDLAKLKLKDDHPKTLLVMNNLAWLLATADDVKFRDPPRAAELAAKAVRLSPDTADYSGTLGTARYRTGDWKQAAADLEKTIRLRGPADCRNANESFFLAMAHWQLGDKPAARKSFDMGIAWMEKGKLRDDEVRRFRAEAAQLLSVKD